ncbi:MAG: hypothetical protein ACHQX3_07190 [Nitrospirales bacterium]
MHARIALITFLDGGPVDPGFGQIGLPGYGGGRPDNSLPGYGHPGNALPVPPVRPSNPIVLPPGVWPPMVPPGVDNTLPLPPEAANKPIVIPPDYDLGIEHPIVIPPLSHDVALLIALNGATPKAGDPPNTKPALLVQPGKKPVLVYVSAGATPK